MPVARQDAVLNASAIEGETHVGAAVVQGEYAAAVTHDKDRPMMPMNDQPPACLQLSEAASTHEIGE